MKYLLVLATIIILVSGCSRIPEPVGYEYSTQEKMQAVHHWNVLANHLSSRINNELIRSDFLNASVFVKETCGDDKTPCEKGTTSEFNEGFRDLLITELVGFGIPVSAVPDSEAITVNYKVQVVRHNTKRLRTVKPGVITSLTTAVAVAQNISSEFLAITLAAGADYINTTYARKTDIEVIITTSMVFRNKYFFRSSDLYYINSADYHHYQKNKGGAKKIQLTSSQTK